MFSPTSLANFLACQHLTALDRAESAGQIKKPFFADPGLDLLVKLGLAHEQKYLRYLIEEQNLQVTRIAQGTSWEDAAAETVSAIRNVLEVRQIPLRSYFRSAACCYAALFVLRPR